MIEGDDKTVIEKLGAAEAVGLKHHDQSPVRPACPCRLQGCGNLCGVMPVVVEDENAALFPLDLKAPCQAPQVRKPFFDILHADVQFQPHQNCAKRVENIVGAGLPHRNPTEGLIAVDHLEIGFKRAPDNIPGPEIGLGAHSIGQVALFQMRNNTLDLLIVQTKGGQAVKGNLVDKFNERLPNGSAVELESTGTKRCISVKIVMTLSKR